jgi:putative Holliday junction resolvase
VLHYAQEIFEGLKAYRLADGGIALFRPEANAARFARVAALIAEWQPATLVVGLPLDAEGGDHDMTRRARRFAHQLEGRFRLPVVLVDERLTSAEADAVLRSRGRGGRDHKQDNHAIAAQLILQAYLDSLESPRA